MFEEVPRDRRRFAGLSRRGFALSRRGITLGPFFVGGGVVLAMVGGSVALAASVITASTIHTSGVPLKPDKVVVASTSAARPSSAATPSSTPVKTVGSSASRPVPRQTQSRIATSQVAPHSTLPVAGLPTPVHVQVNPNSDTPTAHASPSMSGPIGNALIYVSGYDSATSRIVFEYASVERGAGVGGSDLYHVSSPEQYTAYIAIGISITSHGKICQPAGSSCTVADLISAAQTGFFANAAIDSSAQLESIVELENVVAAPQITSTVGQFVVSPTTSAPTPMPSLTASSTASGD